MAVPSKEHWSFGVERDHCFVGIAVVGISNRLARFYRSDSCSLLAAVAVDVD